MEGVLDVDETIFNGMLLPALRSPENHPMTALESCIAEVRSHAASNPPSNEANTLLQVIDPLLRAMGYSVGEIHAEEPTVAHLRADRTLLRGTLQQWFLEAKAWGVPLGDIKFVAQALGYAHQASLSWVVLTNGQEWRLYNDQLSAPIQDRLVWTAHLNDPSEIVPLLTALGRENVVGPGLEASARRQLLRIYLDRALRDPTSGVFRSVQNFVKSARGLDKVSPAEVYQYFQSRLEPQLSTAPPTSVGPEIPQPDPPGTYGDPPQTFPRVETTLAELAMAHSLPTDRRPITVQYPGQQELKCSSWRAVATAVVRWVLESTTSAPVPYRFQTSTAYFLNWSATNEDGSPMRFSAEAPTSKGTVYCMFHLSSSALTRSLCRWLTTSGVDPSLVHIRLG